jgi:trehalose synthase
MLEFVEIDEAFTLDRYSEIAHLAGAVRELRAEAAMVVPQLQQRTVWMVNSTARGGGVAEMLPKVVSLLDELTVPTRWVVVGTERKEFFRLTKRLHNLIHGEGDPDLNESDRQLFEAVNRECADELKPHLKPDDLLVVHDPQPLAVGAFLKQELGIRTIWRCHIGLDEHTPATRAAWQFLRPYANTYDQAVFSAPEYIPDFLAGRSSIIHPALDPESHKNRELPPHKLVGILCNSGLKREGHPVLTPPFTARAQRLMRDGSFAEASSVEEIGLLYRPIVTQVSRWDRLKGFAPLLEGFVRLKKRANGDEHNYSSRHRRQLQIARLVLAGPDPESVSDDPEGQEVLAELCSAYRALPEEIQPDVALLTLPMDSRKQNALTVNALQRCSTIIVQNSIREGFGLTATEAMWKRVPIVGTRAHGLRVQIRQGIDGVLVVDPSNPDEVAEILDSHLQNNVNRIIMSRRAQRRVHQEFLVFTQLRHWVRVLSSVASARTS